MIRIKKNITAVAEVETRTVKGSLIAHIFLHDNLDSVRQHQLFSCTNKTTIHLKSSQIS